MAKKRFSDRIQASDFHPLSKCRFQLISKGLPGG